ncbi:hypothetical protein R20943_00594 [Paraburkholderia aspalathi]|nr:hypothetical protein R20943_00594 [Paraburkholderia aspalathi]
MHYLEHSDDGTFNLRGHDCDTHVNQYVVIPHLVLEAMGNFVCFIMAEQEDVLSMTQLFESIQKEIQRVLKVIAEGDWDIVERADPNSPQRAVD